jgi:hypothetical protein
MEFDVTLRVKVDASLFLLNPDKEDREDHLVEIVLNALYDCDETQVATITVEEIDE